MMPVVAPHQALLAGSRANLAAASATTSACASAASSSASASACASACASAASLSVSGGGTSPRGQGRGSFARAVRSVNSPAISGSDCGDPMFRLAARRHSLTVARTAVTAGRVSFESVQKSRRHSATDFAISTAATAAVAATAAMLPTVATAATAATTATAATAATAAFSGRAQIGRFSPLNPQAASYQPTPGAALAVAAWISSVAAATAARISSPAVARVNSPAAATVARVGRTAAATAAATAARVNSSPNALPSRASGLHTATSPCLSSPAFAQSVAGKGMTHVATATSLGATFLSALLHGNSNISSSNSPSSSRSRCFSVGFSSSSLCSRTAGSSGGASSTCSKSSRGSRASIKGGGRTSSHVAAAGANSGGASSGAGGGSLSERVRKGALVEFEKEHQRHVVGVVIRPEGKKNWIVMDQNGNTFSVKPQQLTFVAIGEEGGFNAADLPPFLSSVEALMADTSLLEMVWEMFLSEQPSVTTHEFAEIAFGESDDPLVPHFAAHRMLSADRIYFKKIRSAAHSFELRPPAQVEQLRKQAAAEATVRAEQEEFVTTIRAALRLPPGEKPTPEIWRERMEQGGEDGGGRGEGGGEDHGGGKGRGRPGLAARLQALLDYAEERPAGNLSLAEESLHLLGCARTPEAACELLVRAGALPLHAHAFRLAASAVPGSFPEGIEAAAAHVAANPPPDLDEEIRVDLTHLKVYTIDSYDTVEVDDGLTAERLPDGRIKVWVHVADPSRWMRLGDRLDTEARKRATSAYLATGGVPMIPFSLAAGPMSLNLPSAAGSGPDGAAAGSGSDDAAAGSDGAAAAGVASNAVCAITVAVTLNPDFSIDDVDIMNSFICPTYRLAYDQLPEMLAMAGDQEPELLLLSDVAAGRLRYRMQQGAVNISIPETDLKVLRATSHCPEISVSTIDQSDPSRRLVSEAMVLAGEAVARFGAERDIPLPYRGQGPPDRMKEEDEEDIQALPEGPSRAVLLRSFMSRSEVKCSGPIPHSGLGLQGYVQFTSPIRRYSDLLAHYQVKAHLRGEPLPLGISDLDGIVSHCAARQREVRRAEGAVERYWLLEYLKRLPANTVLTAVMLKWLRADGSALALVLLEDVGMETVMRMQRDVRLGDIVDVIIAEADPQKDKLRLVEAPPSFREAQSRSFLDDDTSGGDYNGGDGTGSDYNGGDTGDDGDYNEEGLGGTEEGSDEGAAWGDDAVEIGLEVQPASKL